MINRLTGSSSEVAWQNCHINTHWHTLRHTLEVKGTLGPRRSEMRVFVSHRDWRKELEHQALSRLCGLGVHYSGPHGSVSQPWGGNGKLSTTLSTLPTSPSSDRSTWSLSQKSQCPSGVQGKLDKWKARGGKVGQPVILSVGLFFSLLPYHDSGRQWKLLSIKCRGYLSLRHWCHQVKGKTHVRFFNSERKTFFK